MRRWPSEALRAKLASQAASVDLIKQSYLAAIDLMRVRRKRYHSLTITFLSRAKADGIIISKSEGL